jgi:hypothetical protein
MSDREVHIVDARSDGTCATQYCEVDPVSSVLKRRYLRLETRNRALGDGEFGLWIGDWGCETIVREGM